MTVPARLAAAALALAALVALALAAAPAQTPGGPSFQGWSAADRELFHHGSMGSELLPLTWMQALTSALTGKPFLDGIERFGLLPDLQNPDRLPVGLSAVASRDLRFTDKVVGINCAACHTAELIYQGKRVRIEGGSGLFQVDAFAAELTASLKATAGDPKELVAFLGRLAKNQSGTLSQVSQSLLQRFPD